MSSYFTKKDVLSYCLKSQNSSNEREKMLRNEILRIKKTVSSTDSLFALASPFSTKCSETYAFHLQNLILNELKKTKSVQNGFSTVI